MNSVTIDFAQKMLPELVKDVLSGSAIIITKDEEPAAEIVPVSNNKPKATFGSAKGLFEMAEDFNLIYSSTPAANAYLTPSQRVGSIADLNVSQTRLRPPIFSNSLIWRNLRIFATKLMNRSG